MTGNQLFTLAQADDVNIVGGKAFALGLMTRAGFNVPAGFVVSSDVFMAMKAPLQKLILSHFDALQTDFVAVRSSAVNEDGTGAAWAGQLDTILNCTKDNLIESIETCWRSAGSQRARSYAVQKKLPITAVAVVVQEMIQSEISGVAFSIHPVTQDREQIVIEAGLGLGEAIVSGEITPDTYVVNKETKQLTNKFVSHQKKKLTKDKAEMTAWRDTGARGVRQKLTDEEIAKLCALTVKLEDFFSLPVDVEWAIERDKLYVLQCRPVTTLVHM